jgi:hypothetical protein
VSSSARSPPPLNKLVSAMTEISINCPACYEDVVDEEKLACGHYVHEHCLQRWLNTSGNPQRRCPMCKTVLETPSFDNYDEPYSLAVNPEERETLDSGSMSRNKKIALFVIVVLIISILVVCYYYGKLSYNPRLWTIVAIAITLLVRELSWSSEIAGGCLLVEIGLLICLI